MTATRTQLIAGLAAAAAANVLGGAMISGIAPAAIRMAQDLTNNQPSDEVVLLSAADFPASVHGVVTALNEAGIPIVDGSRSGVQDCVPGEDGGVLFGYYSPTENYMVLCTANGSHQDTVETLVHEAVHTVQDCRMGLNNGEDAVGEGTEALWDGLADHHKEAIVEFYAPEHHLYEVEARHFETNPAAVAQGLRTFCF